MKLKNTLLITFLLLSSVVDADSYVYVTDMVPIPMRSDNSIQNNPSNLIKMLDSGTQLKILATENGWTKVKFENTVGWMISRYLTSNTPARVQLERLRRSSNNNQLSLSKQNERNIALEDYILELKKENTALSIQVGKLESEKKHIRSTYQDSLKLEHENKNLRTQTLQLTAELQLLQNNSTIDQDSSSRNWFIVGALVLFFGFIMGFVFPKRTNNNRRF
ncbi:MAG: TIGR04211 family SH3 domain-containing protein [Candidatus Thiodubiliella endoseptemdiera]|uniref:TIGR04211 family SH3 domain-containing protein n=1 Tax=Candidatus Thiodubiliella endoseptemdiera TaxID=2738886 RepID=A0A853F011_9GAMM|nr:TIGR04211 family SH3 domain-containing protein [Candidatus Thiodubiliella endoseptemdiera]